MDRTEIYIKTRFLTTCNLWWLVNFIKKILLSIFIMKIIIVTAIIVTALLGTWAKTAGVCPMGGAGLYC